MTDASEVCRVANEHFAAGRFTEALDGYKLVLDVSPDQAAIHMNIGAALRGLGRREEALESLNKSIELDETVGAAWWNKGLLLEDMDCLDEALEAFNKCIELDPSNEQAVYQRVNLLNIRHRFGDAISAAQEALKTDAGNIMLHLELVLAAINEHDKDILLEECTFLKSKESELNARGSQLYSLALFEVANQLSSDPAQREKALEFYNATIAIKESASMHFNKAVCCMSMQKYEEAEEALKKCLELSSEPNGQAQFLLANLYMQKAKYKEAAECYAKVTEPDHTACFNYAIALVKLGQHGKALTQAKKAVDKKPDFEDAKKLIKSIEYTTNAKAVPEAEQDAEAQSLPKAAAAKPKPKAAPAPAPAPAPKPKPEPEPEPEQQASPAATNEVIAHEEANYPVYPYSQLKARAVNVQNWSELEKYLSDDEFVEVFKMDKETFSALPKWKRNQRKKEVHLF